MPKEWAPYRCELPLQKFGATSELTTVFHVTHAQTALRIVEDGQISRGLVFDKSKLNVTRRTVVWMSPNSWYNGSRYGTVQFQFDWASLIQGKDIYWVEAMTGYSPHAPRFFITAGDVSGLPPLQAYDPTIEDGPLRFQNGSWWWRNDCTLEIMIDDDMPLSACQKIEFVKHHDQYCNIGHSRCTELGKSGDISASTIMAYILTTGRTSANHAFLENGVLTFSAERALSNICSRLGAFSGKLAGPIKKDRHVAPLVEGALGLLALGQKTQAKALVARLASDTVFWRNLQTLCLEHFGVTSPTLQESIDS